MGCPQKRKEGITMFCNQCGRQIPDDVRFCPGCGALVGGVPQEPVPVAAQEPESSFSFSPQQDYGEQPEMKKPKLGKGKVALLVVLGVVVIAAVVALLNMNAIRAYFVRNSSPASFMQTVEGEAVNGMVDSFSNTYGKLLESVGKPGGFTGSLEVQLSDSTMAMLSSMLAQQGADVDLSWLSNIVFDTESRWDGNRSSVNLGVGLGDVQIATFQIIMDMEQMKMWLAVPELHQEYLVVNLADFYSMEMGDASVMMQQAQTMLRGLVERMPEEETVNSLMKRYVSIVLARLNDVEKQETTLKLNGLEQTCTELQTTITQENALEILDAVLSEAKSDAQLKEIILDLGEFAEENGAVVSAQQIYDGFVTQVEGVLNELEKEKEQVAAHAEDPLLVVYHYVDGQNRIIGRGVEMFNGDSTSAGNFHYYTVTQGDEFAFEADLSPIVITGDGTISGNLRSGSYVLTVQGQEMLRLETEDWDQARWEQGTPCGTLRLSLGRDILNQVPVSAEMMPMIAQMQLAVTFDVQENQTDIQVDVLSGGVEIVSLLMNGTSTPGGEISLPMGGVDVNDQQALSQWVMGVDFAQLLENLYKTEIPQEYLQQLEMMLAYAMP